MTAGTKKITTTPRGRAAALRPVRGLFGFGVMLVAALLAVAAVFFAAEAGAQTQTDPLAGKIVVIDPGHGGSDLGATYTFPKGSGYTGTITEKEQNLLVAEQLQKNLEGRAKEVILTRTRVQDRNLTNTQRAEIANKAGAHLLVSIHMNGSTNAQVDYTTTLFGKWQKDKAFAYEIFYGLRTLPAANGTGTIATRTPYSYASGVLLKSNMPATIAETVFITNEHEAKWLARGMTDGTYERQVQIAQALETGVVAYLK